MANYTAADIKALRERTGAGMLDVKKALDAADGDAEKAIEIIRTKGLARAAKREGNTASEGLVAVKVEDTAAGQVATMIELNAETDFVVKNEKFIALADAVLTAAAAAGASDEVAAAAAPVRRGHRRRPHRRTGRHAGREDRPAPCRARRGPEGHDLPAQDGQGPAAVDRCPRRHRRGRRLGRQGRRAAHRGARPEVPHA